MWFFLWILIVLGVIGFFLWSYHELFEQKRLWKKFAERYNLLYQGGRFSDSPAMTGDLKGRKINLYPMPTDNTQGGVTTYNVIEVFLNKIPNVACLVASVGFSDFVAAIDLPEPFEVKHPNWPENILSRTLLEEDASAWFQNTEDHIMAIQTLVKLPFHVAFVADRDQAFVAIRTANPLNDEKKFNMLLKKLYMIAGMLESYPKGHTGEDSNNEAVVKVQDTQTDSEHTDANINSIDIDTVGEDELSIASTTDNDPNLPPIEPDQSIENTENR